MGFTGKRIVAIVTLVAAVFAIFGFNNFDLQAVVSQFSEFRESFNELVGRFEFGPLRGWGDAILIFAGITAFLLLTYERKPKWAVNLADFIRETGRQRRVPPEAQKAGKQPAERQSEAPKPAAERLHFKEVEIINAPKGRVWETISEGSRVPTCQKLMKSVEILAQTANSISWEGKIGLGTREFPIRGATKLSPTEKVEISITSGALRGLRGTFYLEEVEAGTKVREEVVLDPSSTSEEYSSVIDTFSAIGSDILTEDLGLLRELAEQPD